MTQVSEYPFFKEEICKQTCLVVGNMLALLSLKGFSKSEQPSGAIVFVNKMEGVSFDQALVYQQFFGEGDLTQFSAVAKRKARVTYQTGLPSRMAAQTPTLLALGSTYYPGSWIEGNVIVAFSGIEGELDEVLAKLACSLIIAKGRMDLKDVIAKGGGII